MERRKIMSGTTDNRKDPGLKVIKENGQQESYLVLSEDERAKEFIRPVRRSYIHKECGGVTHMNQKIAETYARDPYFYNGTFCAICGKHFDLLENGERQFTWGDGTGVGE